MERYEMRLRLIIVMSLLVLTSCAAGMPHPDEIQETYTISDGRSRSLYLYSRARLATHDGDYPAALALLREAIERDPDSALLHSEVAEIKLKIGQVPEALEYIAKAIKLFQPTLVTPDRYFISTNCHDIVLAAASRYIGSYTLA